MSNAMKTLRAEIALAGLKIGAIKVNPTNPFQWASGTFNPIYNDNRMFLFSHNHRRLIVQALIEVVHIHQIKIDVVAGTSTAGIPHAALLADALGLPMIYIRDKPKDHGLRNQIEGIDNTKDLEGANVGLIEDLISVGGSSARAVDAIRKANGKIDYCISIFNYGLLKAAQTFSGEIPYGPQPGEKLSEPCNVVSLLWYPDLLRIAIDNGYISKEHEEMLKEWMSDQENWGDRNGFPRVIK